MKKILLLLTTVFVLVLAGCGNSQHSSVPVSQDTTEEQAFDENNDSIGSSCDMPLSGTVSIQSVPGENSSPTSWFKKTTKKCSICKSGNGCSGYWGIYHSNGTYEGACQNSDGWGHRCGHGPEKHGLKRW